MKLPGAENAVIAPEKLRDYLLNPTHVDGGPKAKLLISLGYSSDRWEQLETDIRSQVLGDSPDVDEVEDNDYGRSFVIVRELIGPTGRGVLFRTIWQTDAGIDAPRLITMYPEK